MHDAHLRFADGLPLDPDQPARDHAGRGLGRRWGRNLLSGDDGNREDEDDESGGSRSQAAHGFPPKRSESLHGVHRCCHAPVSEDFTSASMTRMFCSDDSSGYGTPVSSRIARENASP